MRISDWSSDVCSSDLIGGGVAEPHGLRLDGDAALALQLHRVEHLLLHLAVAEAAAELDQAVGQGGLAMVDVSDDREVTDVGQVGHAWLYGTASGNAAAPSVTGAAGASEDRARRAAEQRPPSPTADPLITAPTPRRAGAPSAFSSNEMG